MTKQPSPGAHKESGLSLVEALVGLLLALLVAITAYDCIDWGCRSFQEQSDQADAQAVGRASLDLMGRDILAAGYSPLTAKYDAIPQGTGTRVRMLSDRDGDGLVGTAGELNEDLTYRFSSVGGGLFELQRGIDLNGDGDFVDTDESVDLVSGQLVAVDMDGDGSDEPFFAYDVAPPESTRIRITFGVQEKHRNRMREEFEVTTFQSEFVLRNALVW